MVTPTRSALLVRWLAVVPITAQASSLVFTTPDGNIYPANLSGSGQYQVTLDGTTANQYSARLCATTPQLRHCAARVARASVYRMAQNGKQLSAPFATAAPEGTLDAVISRDGSVCRLPSVGTRSRLFDPKRCLAPVARTNPGRGV
jgi:hypothetical protein